MTPQLLYSRLRIIILCIFVMVIFYVLFFSPSSLAYSAWLIPCVRRRCGGGRQVKEQQKQQGQEPGNLSRVYLAAVPSPASCISESAGYPTIPVAISPNPSGLAGSVWTGRGLNWMKQCQITLTLNDDDADAAWWVCSV